MRAAAGALVADVENARQVKSARQRPGSARVGYGSAPALFSRCGPRPAPPTVGLPERPTDSHSAMGRSTPTGCASNSRGLGSCSRHPARSGSRVRLGRYHESWRCREHRRLADAGFSVGICLSAPVRRVGASPARDNEPGGSATHGVSVTAGHWKTSLREAIAAPLDNWCWTALAERCYR